MSNKIAGAQERRRLPRTNEMLAARVCVAIEESIPDSDDIQVFADNGKVTLRGAARADDMVDLLNVASSVGGVTLVSSDLDTF
jgi:osmotically-inducible protein OsmY